MSPSRLERIVKFKLLVCLFAGLISSTLASAQDMSEEEIKNRIKPVGSVHVSGAVAETAASGPRSGADVYATACLACHASGVLGAPKFQDAGDWAPRLEQGFDTVLSHAINGFKAMPPKGGCGSCSDDDIKAAIEHMIEGI